MNEVIFLFFVMMMVGVYFRIRDLITATLQENVMMAKYGRYYRSYEHIFRNNTHNCDGCVNLVFHSFSNIQCKHFAFQVLFHSLTGKSAPVSSSGQCRTQTHTADLSKTHTACCQLPDSHYEHWLSAMQRKDPYRTGWQLVIFY